MIALYLYISMYPKHPMIPTLKSEYNSDMQIRKSMQTATIAKFAMFLTPYFGGSCDISH